MNAAFLIRPAVAADLPGVVSLQHEAEPLHPWTVPELEKEQEPRFQHHFLVAEAEGRILGMAHYQRPPGSAHPGHFMVEVCVHRPDRGRGIGRALCEAALEALRGLDANTLLTSIHEADAGSLRFAQTRGFAELKRDFLSFLDLKAFDPAPYAGLEAALRASDVVLHNFQELDRPDFRRDFHETWTEVRVDIPRSTPPTPLSLAFFEENVLDDADLLPTGFVFGLKEGRILGFTGTYRSAEPGDVDTWLTAVRREARGLHLATALKVRSLIALKALGFRRVRTDNDTRNQPMLRVNERLGFQRQSARITMQRVLQANPS